MPTALAAPARPGSTRRSAAGPSSVSATSRRGFGSRTGCRSSWSWPVRGSPWAPTGYPARASSSRPSSWKMGPAPRAAGPRASIEVDRPASLPPVMGAEEQVDHVVHNLVDHAVVYSPPGATVRVEARRVGRNVEVHIVDDGPGRDGRAATGAFDLFHTSARSAADPSGANLGLVVTRRLVLAMGGRIWASSDAPGGELAVSLPIARRP